MQPEGQVSLSDCLCEVNLIIQTDKSQNHLGAEVRLQSIVLPLLPHENYCEHFSESSEHMLKGFRSVGEWTSEASRYLRREDHDEEGRRRPGTH